MMFEAFFHSPPEGGKMAYFGAWKHPVYVDPSFPFIFPDPSEDKGRTRKPLPA